MRKPSLLVFLVLLTRSLSAQTDSIPSILQEDLIESFASGKEETTPFDYNDLFDRLNFLIKHPLNLNEATATDLEDFPFLNTLQRSALPEYRKIAGNLISVYELQAVPGYDLETIRQLLPFVRVDQPGLLANPVFDEFRDDRSQLLLRWARTLESRKGFEIPLSDSTSDRYLGDRNRLYFRYKYMQQNRFAFGLTAEKDAGEEFFNGSNKQGFDFYSAHLFLQNPLKGISSVALGDYSVSMGQGLLVYQGFAPRKSSLSTIIKRSGRSLRPYSSVNEYDFFRGAAVSVEFGKNLEWLCFGSVKKQDANQVLPEPVSPDEPSLAYVTSLQTSGLHRTRSEIEDENVLTRTSAGGILTWKNRRFQLALNGLYEQIDPPLKRRPGLYNQFHFNGNELLTMSFDYAWTHRNFHFFGETAHSGNGAWATLNGLLISLDRKTDLVMLYRNFGKDFQSFHAKPFAESAGGNNEKGIYLGLQIQPQKQWRINAYFDLYRHPWLRFQADAPSGGYEWLARLTYTRRKSMEIYFQLRQEIKEQNSPDHSGPFDYLSQERLFQVRLQLSYQLHQSVEWRSRIDAGVYRQESREVTGFAAYQDVIFRKPGSPLSFSTRFAIFDTGGYDVRFYAYERDVSNDFSIPAFYDRGTRFYFNLGYRLGRQWRIEARYARTYFANLSVTGTGLEEINGAARSDVKLQARWEF